MVEDVIKVLGRNEFLPDRRAFATYKCGGTNITSTLHWLTTTISMDNCNCTLDEQDLTIIMVHKDGRMIDVP